MRPIGVIANREAHDSDVGFDIAALRHLCAAYRTQLEVSQDSKMAQTNQSVPRAEPFAWNWELQNGISTRPSPQLSSRRSRCNALASRWPSVRSSLATLACRTQLECMMRPDIHPCATATATDGVLEHQQPGNVRRTKPGPAQNHRVTKAALHGTTLAGRHLSSRAFSIHMLAF